MPEQPLIHQLFIVENHPAMRQAYVDLIARETDLEICGVAATAIEALKQIPKCRPDIALIDISLDGMSGIELTRQLKTMQPELPILIISGHEEAFYARKAIQAGARGYITKRRVRMITQAIQVVLQGEIYVSTPLKKS